MSVQIRAIAVYSSDGERRDIQFKLGRLNILTGGSKTGKSALLDIVDYCWGRDECTIPRGEMRRNTSWFALLLDRDGEGIFIARKNPDKSAKSSDEIYFQRAMADLPADASTLSKNITSDGLRTHLSNLLGISENLYRPERGATRPPLEASSGHAILFSLQFQYEIATPRHLFHRQTDPFIPAAIKDTLPYFVGAMEDDHFIKLKRYEEARTRLRKLQREFEESKALSDDARGTALNLAREARRHNLVSGDILPDNLEELRQLLSAIAEGNAPSDIEADDPTADLDDLVERRRELRSHLQDIREEITDLQRLQREATAFEKEATEQRARLSSIGLVLADTSKHDLCPLCESHLETAVPSVDDMERSLRSIEFQLQAVGRDNPRLQSRIGELESKRANAEEDMRTVQRDITQRIAENERLRMEQAQFTEQARVRGRIGYYLENVQAVTANDGLRMAIARTNAEVEELAAAIDQESMEERMATALSIIGRNLTRYASILNLEHGQNPLRLDRKNLTVVADTIEGPLPLAQIGSGENWVGYHIAAHLALHQLFRARNRPVPAFLMFDQPSQAHYPREADVGAISGDDEDQLAVTNVYRLLYDFALELTPRMQIIVTDHVELLKDWFRESITEKWRDGIKFIPADWLR